jgi:hypothetical protein
MPDAWPGGLPQYVLREGYSEAFSDGLLRAKVDTGPAKVRRRTSAAPRPVSFQLELTRAQLDTLRTFVDTTVIGGSLPFTFPAPTQTATTWLVRFSENGLPRITSLGGDTFMVDFGIEILP